MKGGWALAALVTALGCRPSATSKAAEAPVIERCEYQLELTAAGKVNVEASCKASGAVVFRAPLAIARRVSGSMPHDKAGRFRASAGRLSYTLDLAAMAQQGEDFDFAAQVGASFVAPLSSVLLAPEPLSTEIPVTVLVSAPAGVGVAVGLKRAGAPNTYQLLAHEISVATYFSFGKLQQRELDVGGGALELSQLDGQLDQAFGEIANWVETSARAVRDFYGTFPVPRASITLIPIAGRDSVVFGKVLPESEPGIALLLGQHATRQALYQDWILIHELFHLGFPSFYAEGKWLDEGLATYYEPIIRVRAGLYTELQLWDELEKSLPQGLPAYTQLGLEQAHDFRGVYWGGALACLVADVAARKRRLDTGLEVGLRALRDKGGVATEVWSLADAIAVVDDALGAPTLAPIAQRHGAKGSPLDLPALLRDLGVTRKANGKLELSDAAPLAAVRRAITRKP